MSTNRKALKIVSLLQIVMAAVAVFLGCLGFFAGNLAEEEAGILGVLVANIDGILYLVCAVLTFFCAVMGIHGANQPSRLGSHRLIAVLVVVFAVLTIFAAGLGADIPVAAALIGVLALVAAVLDGMCRKEADL